MLIVFFAFGCGGTVVQSDELNQALQWQSPHYREHPLVGQMWVAGQTEPLSRIRFLEMAQAAQFVLIGERHDNPDHHILQGRIVAQLLAVQKRAIAFEMLDEDDPPNLSALSTANAISEATGWADSGWPPFDLYKPIFDAALAGGAPIIAAHPRRARIRAYAMAPVKEGQNETPPASYLSDENRAILEEDIRVSHCNYAPPKMVKAMVKVQSFKDEWMSQQLRTTGQKAILIAGNGHVRKDYGIPNVLGTDAMSVGLIEVDDERNDPKAYNLERYDVVWFTPRIDDRNPCDVFREQLEKMKHSGTKIEL